MKKLMQEWKRYIDEILLQESNICNPYMFSSGWITPKAELITLEQGEDHSDWSKRYLKEKGIIEYDEEPIDYMTKNLKWIRVSNAFAYEGPDPRNVSSDQWEKQALRIYELVAGCIRFNNKKPENMFYETSDWGAGSFKVTEPPYGFESEDVDMERFIDNLYKKKPTLRTVKPKSALAYFRQ